MLCLLNCCCMRWMVRVRQLHTHTHAHHNYRFDKRQRSQNHHHHNNNNNNNSEYNRHWTHPLSVYVLTNHFPLSIFYVPTVPHCRSVQWVLVVSVVLSFSYFSFVGYKSENSANFVNSILWDSIVVGIRIHFPSSSSLRLVLLPKPSWDQRCVCV